MLGGTTGLQLHFKSDATGGYRGYWVDDMAIMYDQRSHDDEFASTVSDLIATFTGPGTRGTTWLAFQNTGNATKELLVEVTDMPAGWWAFPQAPTASTDQTGLTFEVPPRGGEADLRVRLDVPPAQPGATTTTPCASPHVTTSTGISSWNSTPRSSPRATCTSPHPCPPVTCRSQATCPVPVIVSNNGTISDTFVLTPRHHILPPRWDLNLSVLQGTQISLAQGRTRRS